MHEIWVVLAACLNLKGQCVFSPGHILPSSVACFAYGRNLQLDRGLPMNSFECRKLEIKG